MKPRRVLATHDATEIFDRAVRERALAVLTLQEGRDWITFKSRFLERDSHGQFFVLDYEPANGEELPAIAPGQYVGVSFRQKSRKILFATVVEAKGHYLRDDQTSVPAVRYRWPDSMTELQRRAYYRTPVPQEMTFSVNLWSGGSTARGQGGADGQTAVAGELGDLSCGGALVRFNRGTLPNWPEGELLGAEIQLPDGRQPVLLDARHRGTRLDEAGTPGLAVQFVGLELTIEGRQVLQRLANCVQRLHRLGIASGRRDWNSRNRL